MENIFKKTKILLFLILVTASLLRFWGLGRVPVSLFSDELDVGYQAYSILKTGKDYFGNLWPLHFESYADFRAPLYIYTSVPTVAIFGITPWGVRLPAAFFGILGVWAIYLLAREVSGRQDLGLVAALLLSLSPWHIQYSRAAFEVTMLLTFLLFGIYFFFKALKKSKFLWISTMFLVLTPWIYNTATLFTPLLILFLFLVWKKDILKIKKAELLKAGAVGFAAGFLIFTSIVFGGASKRAGYLSVFTDPTTKTEVNYSILYDAQVRNIYGGGLFSKVFTRVVHNKLTFWSSKVINNYISSLSAEFLFLKGDPNLRHSIGGVGELYKIEIIPLILGVIFFFTRFKDRKIKLLILFWILAGILPAAITRDGGNHATRLILILPPLIFLISYGLVEGLTSLKGRLAIFIPIVYFLFYLVNFGFYEHNYWIHNPWYSERSWQAGYKEAIELVRKKQNNYKRIVLTNANDDPRIFFASYYPADPENWQKGLGKEEVSGFGDLEHFSKFYFGQVDGKVGIAGLAGYLDDGTLYVASSREIKWNLVMEPERLPKGLTLLQTVQYPSGEPAFYFFLKN